MSGPALRWQLAAALVAALAALTGPARAQTEPTSAEVAHEARHAEHGDGEHAAAEAHGEEDLGAHAGASEGHGEGHEPAIDPIQLAASIVNFVVWIIALVWLLRGPLRDYLRSRRRAVEEGLQRAEELQAKAQRVYDEYTDRLEHLDEELDTLRAEMRRAGEAEKERLVEEARARGERMRREAEFLIDQQMKQLRVDLTREAIEAAVAAAETVLQERSNAEDQVRLADRYLESLERSIHDNGTGSRPGGAG
ncbi:MAG: hypothetical protein ACFCGT_09580 [Sandaracinaceae bacterium]